MSKPLSKTLMSLITEIETKGFVFMCEGDRTKLEAHGYEFEVNPDFHDPSDADFIGTRFKTYAEDDATSTNSQVAQVAEQEHNSVISSQHQPAEQSANIKEVNKMSKFAIATVAIAALPAAPRASAKYPFEMLEVGQSFFVPNSTSDKGDAAKTLASTVSGKNLQHSVVVEGETEIRRGKEVPKREAVRKFETRRVLDGAPWGDEFAGVAGAAVVRTL